MNYYLLNRQELLQKIKDRHHNVGGKKKLLSTIFKKTKKLWEKTQKNKYRNLSEWEKEAKQEYGKIDIETW